MAVQAQQQIIRNEPTTLFSGQDFPKPGYRLIGWVGSGKISSSGPEYEPGQVVQDGFDSDNTDLYAMWKRDFSQCTMTLSPTSYSYSGDDETYPVISVGKPAETVKDVSEHTLVYGTDYALYYEPSGGEIRSGTTMTLSVIAEPLWPDSVGTLVKTYTASYSQNVKYMLSYQPSPDGSGSITGKVNGLDTESGQMHDQYAFYQLTATGNSGYWFYIWDVLSSGSGINYLNPVLSENLNANVFANAYFKPAESTSGHPVKSLNESASILMPAGQTNGYKHIGAVVTNENSTDVTVTISFPTGRIMQSKIIPAKQMVMFDTMSGETAIGRVKCRETPAASGAPTDDNVTVTIYWLDYDRPLS